VKLRVEMQGPQLPWHYAGSEHCCAHLLVLPRPMLFAAVLDVNT
jgi:hypothetical protein